jgi:hypothetical protein
MTDGLGGQVIAADERWWTEVHQNSDFGQEDHRDVDDILPSLSDVLTVSSGSTLDNQAGGRDLDSICTVWHCNNQRPLDGILLYFSFGGFSSVHPLAGDHCHIYRYLEINTDKLSEIASVVRQ